MDNWKQKYIILVYVIDLKLDDFFSHEMSNAFWIVRHHVSGSVCVFLFNKENLLFCRYFLSDDLIEISII